jgi:methylenetetrahydrofolate reductase (NADPH)
VGVGADAGAAGAALRVGDLWRGGSTRERTHATVARIARETDIPAAAHLTCVQATRGEIDEIARAYWDVGVRHIVALRGDPPVMGEPFASHPEGYANAAELVAGLKAIAPFEISVAAYPECHPDSRNRAADLDNLWRKIDAGADRAISQFFFSPDCFFRFRDQAAAMGIDAEIVPGILPVSNVAQTRKFAIACGASIPPGWTGCSRGWTTCPPRASWSRPRWRPNCAASSTRAACATSTSTP